MSFNPVGYALIYLSAASPYKLKWSGPSVSASKFTLCAQSLKKQQIKTLFFYSNRTILNVQTLKKSNICDLCTP